MLNKIMKYVNFLKMVNINLTDLFKKKETPSMCGKKIEIINLGLSRTGTQSFTKIYEKNNYKVFNSIQHYQKKEYNAMLMKYLKTNNLQDFKDYYYFILNNNHEALFVSDIPLNFLYKEILTIQGNSTVLYYTYRKFENWIESFETLISTFSPLFGLPFSIFINNEYFLISTLLFEKYVNCKIKCYDLIGFCFNAYIENINDCSTGYNNYYKKIKNNNNIIYFNLTTEKNMSVTKTELTFIYCILLFVQVMFCIFILLLFINFLIFIKKNYIKKNVTKKKVTKKKVTKKNLL